MTEQLAASINVLLLHNTTIDKFTSNIVITQSSWTLAKFIPHPLHNSNHIANHSKVAKANKFKFQSEFKALSRPKGEAAAKLRKEKE